MTKESENRTNVREIILDICLEILESGAYSHLVLFRALDKYQYLGKQDRAFITRVSEGTLERVITIDAVIGRFSRVKVKKMKPVIREILRMSVYQILYMDRVPDSAACDEAVKLAKKRRFDGLSGFVNGILRTVSREKGSLAFDDASVLYSMPEWILAMWESAYGRETAETIAASFLEKRGLTVRINASLADRETVEASLVRQGIAVQEPEFFGLRDFALVISGYDYLEQVEAFRNGWIAVQDPSSILACMAAGPKEGDFVLDICAAPGGKSLHMADLLAGFSGGSWSGGGVMGRGPAVREAGGTSGRGMVEARDLTEAKADLIRQNIGRSGAENIRVRVWDARVFDESMEGRADIVLADLPCSGLGVIGKKPDIKLRLRPEDLDALAALQREILSNAVRYVKPGGTLVYSTCTIDRKENEENAAWLLKNFPLREARLSDRMPKELSGSCEGGHLQLLPGFHACDGFFISVFEREN